MRATVAPYLQPPVGTVNHSGWRVVDAAGDIPLASDVPHWDYQCVLPLAAAISIERETALQHCQLDVDSELAVIVTARSDHTSAHGAIANVVVPRQARYDLAVEARLPGHSLGGRLELMTALVVTHPRPLGPLAPRRPRSILWRDRQRSNLEGSASRFPTDAADFRETRPSEARSSWHLHVDITDPDASFMSAARLTLNTASEAIRRLLAGHPAPDTPLLLRTLRWDVTRQLVMYALSWEEVDDSPADHDSTTVAGVLRSLLAQIWPLDAPSAIRERWRQNPELLELQIQHHAYLLPD
jgi:hypothetical protein